MEKLIRLVVTFFSLVLVTSTSLEIFEYRSELSKIPYQYYFYLSLYFIVIYLNRSIFRKNAVSGAYKSLKLQRPFFTLLTVSLIVGTFFVSKEYQSREVWLDEYSQSKVSLPKFGYMSMEWAWEQQQTPMDYQLSFISGRVLGYGKFSIKFFAILSFFLCLLFVPLLVNDLFGGVYRGFFALSVYLLNFRVISYSVEARPTQLAQLWALLYVYMSLKLIRDRGINSWSLYASVTSLFLLTIGLQPVFLVFATGLTLLVWSAFKERGLTLKILTVKILGVLILAPSIYEMVQRSLAGNKFYPDAAERLALYIERFEFSSYLFFFQGYSVVGFLLLAFAALGVFFTLKKKNENLGLFPILSIITLFCLFFHVFFLVNIRWPLYFKYVIVLVPVVLFGVGYVAKQLSESFPFIAKLRPLLLVGLVLGLSFGSLSYGDKEWMTPPFKHSSFHSDFYDHLASSLNERGRVIRLSFAKFDDWRNDMWISKEVYVDPSVQAQFLEPSWELGFGKYSGYLIKQDEFYEDFDFYFVMVGLTQDEVDFLLSKHGISFQSKMFEKVAVYKVSVSGPNRRERYYDIFRAMLSHSRKDELGQVYETLFYGYYEDRNLEEMRKIVQDLGQLKVSEGTANSSARIANQFINVRIRSMNEAISSVENDKLQKSSLKNQKTSSL